MRNLKRIEVRMEEITDENEVERMRYEQSLRDMRLKEQKDKKDYNDEMERCENCKAFLNLHDHCPRCDY